MGNLFLLWFCLRNLFVKNENAPCYARLIHGKEALALGQLQLARSFHIHDREGRKWLSASRSLKIRDLFVKYRDAPCYARPIHGKEALALGQLQLARSFHIHDREGRKWLNASRSLKIRAKFRMSKMQRGKSSVIVCEKYRAS